MQRYNVWALLLHLWRRVPELPQSPLPPPPWTWGSLATNAQQLASTWSLALEWFRSDHIMWKQSERIVYSFVNFIIIIMIHWDYHKHKEKKLMRSYLTVVLELLLSYATKCFCINYFWYNLLCCRHCGKKSLNYPENYWSVSYKNNNIQDWIISTFDETNSLTLAWASVELQKHEKFLGILNKRNTTSNERH